MSCELHASGAIVCVRGRQSVPRCVHCHKPSTKLCDFDVTPGRTCAAPICASCSTSGGRDLDYCREHRLRAPGIQLALLETAPLRTRLPIGHTLVGACPVERCGGDLVLRFSRRHRSLFYGCSRYPRCASVRGAHPDGHPLEVASVRSGVRR